MKKIFLSICLWSKRIAVQLIYLHAWQPLIALKIIFKMQTTGPGVLFRMRVLVLSGVSIAKGYFGLVCVASEIRGLIVI